MRFRGDIIITDPCYFVKSDNVAITEEQKKLKPRLEDYLSYTMVHQYPDAELKDPSEYTASDKSSIEHIKRLKELDPNFDDKKWMPQKSKLQQEEFNKLIEAEREWNMKYADDWTKTGCGADLSIIGLSKWLSSDTLYGDWSCTTFDADTKQPIGKFCADSGMVAVALLDEVLKYNPKFDYHTERPWTTTLIKDFDGKVDFEVVHTEGVYEDTTEWHKKGDKWEDDSLIVVGKGNINFRTTQTGF